MTVSPTVVRDEDVAASRKRDVRRNTNSRTVLTPNLKSLLTSLPVVRRNTSSRPILTAIITEGNSTRILPANGREKPWRLEGGMSQLAGTKARYRRAHAAPLAGLISGRGEKNFKANEKGLATITRGKPFEGI